MKWNHDELMRDLAAHLDADPRRMVWTNITLGPQPGPRPDCYAISKSYTHPAPIAYECKVSVEDFRRDATAGKWINYLKYAEGVYFAIPKGLIDKKDIPSGAGLIVRFEGGWRAVKRPTLAPVALPQDVLIKLLIAGRRQAWSWESEVRNKAHDWRGQQAIERKYGKEVARALSDIDDAKFRAQSILKSAQRQKEQTEQEAAKWRDMQTGALKEVIRNIAEAFDLQVDESSDGESIDLTAYNLRWLIAERLKRMDENEEIAHLREQIESIRHALDLAKPLSSARRLAVERRRKVSRGTRTKIEQN